MDLTDIIDLAKRHAADRDELSRAVTDLNSAIDAVRKLRLPAVRAAARNAAESRERLIGVANLGLQIGEDVIQINDDVACLSDVRSECAQNQPEPLNEVAEKVAFENHYVIECFGPDGKLKWVDDFFNLVTDEGINDNLAQYLKGSAYTAAFYVGLTAGAPTAAAGDTMASHVGWTEVVAYAETVRQTLVLGAVALKSVDNSASKATFSINAAATVGGAFITTDSTKSGGTGKLYGIGAFAGGDKVLGSGDTLNVTVTLTASAL